MEREVLPYLAVAVTEPVAYLVCQMVWRRSTRPVIGNDIPIVEPLKELSNDQSSVKSTVSTVDHEEPVEDFWTVKDIGKVTDEPVDTGTVAACCAI
jgi:hypothetical protein